MEIALLEGYLLVMMSAHGIPRCHGYAPHRREELWDWTPPEVRAYLGVLEARVAS
jgi:hypothetical protein